MIAAEENELLTRVGPDTPMGELLRRYWYPYRKMLKDNLCQMQLDQEPINVCRDPAEAACIELTVEAH